MSVGFAVPSIPPRGDLLARAVRSIAAQTVPVDDVSIAFDTRRRGAGPTRNDAKNALATDWTCFLDDDDEVLPHHVEHLLAVATATEADVVFPWFEVIGGTDPFPGHRGLTWDPAAPHIFPITVLGRTDVLQALDFDDPMDPSCGAAGEDFTYWKALAAKGAVIVHTPEITWRWHHDSGNTAGLPSRW